MPNEADRVMSGLVTETLDAEAGPSMRGDPTPPSTALAVAPARRVATTTLIRPVAPVAELMRAQQEVTDIITSLLIDGTDYGTIKGTKKPTLYKAGAERTCRAFGCIPEYTIIEHEADAERPMVALVKRWNNRTRDDKTFTMVEQEVLGFYRYVVRCDLVHGPSGEVVGYGLGVCSSVESKYQDRPNELENTILKMACKRAHVAATLNAFALSDRFTQDMEDRGDAEPARGSNATRSAAAESEVERIPDSVPTDDPADTMPPRNYPIQKVLGEFTDKQLATAITYFDAAPDKRAHYPVFVDALAAVAVGRGLLETPPRG